MKGEHWTDEHKSEKRKKEKSIFIRTFYWVLVLSFVGVTIYIFLFSSFVNITTVVLSGTEDVRDESIYSEVDNMLSGEYIGILSRSNFFLVSGKKISRNLTESFKKIESAEISREFPDKLLIHIKERDYFLLWCDSENKCFIIDNNGVIGDRIDLESEEIKENNVIRIIDLSGREVHEGEDIVSDEYVRFIIDLDFLFSNMDEFDFKKEYFIKTRVSEEVIATSAEGWEIYVDTRILVEDFERNMLTFFSKHISDPQQRLDLEYVDFRSGSKVFYKMRSEEIETEEETEEDLEESEVEVETVEQ